jgi:hypothetical protein
MLIRLASLVLSLVLLGSYAASSDDLAALAKKEKERRAKLAKPARVYTEEDGKAAGSATVTTVPGPPEASPETSPTGGPSKADQRAMWKARADAARAEIVASQARLEDLKRQYAEYESDIAEVPAAEILDPMRRQKREVRLAEMRAQIEQQRQIAADASKSLTVLETEARKNRIPPGWLR